MDDITVEVANRAINAAMRKSQKMSVKQNIAVVDRGGHLKAFARMDGAWLGSIDIAIRKARTARFFDLKTGDLGKMSKPNGPLYGIEVSNGGLISFPGGIPLTNAEGDVVGAIGVSGGTVKEDQAVARRRRFWPVSATSRLTEIHSAILSEDGFDTHPPAWNGPRAPGERSPPHDALVARAPLSAFARSTSAKTNPSRFTTCPTAT